MNPQKRFVFLRIIMVDIAVGVEATVIRLLYRTAIAEEQERLSRC